MWEQLLLLLPRHYSPREVAFHRERSLRAYQHIVDDFLLTGFRDRVALRGVRQNLFYSMGILHAADRDTWKRLEKTYKQLNKLRKNVFPTGIAAAIVSKL